MMCIDNTSTSVAHAHGFIPYVRRKRSFKADAQEMSAANKKTRGLSGVSGTYDDKW